MFHSNLHFVSAASFRANPRTAQEEFDSICQAVIDNNLSVTPEIPTSAAKTMPQHTGLSPANSSLNGNSNIQSTTTSSQRFAAVPNSPEEEFRNLCDILVHNQALEITPTGGVVQNGANASAQMPGKRTNLTANSSLNGNSNIQSTTTSSQRFAAEGLPFSTPQPIGQQVENVTYTADNLIRITPTAQPAAASTHARPQSSLNNKSNLTTATAERFAAPWYQTKNQLNNNVTGKPLGLTGEQLYNSEIQLMLERYPQAKMGFFKTTGECYWVLPVEIDTGRTKRNWTFMLKYDNNHPHADNFGGSVKAIPMSPTLSELDTWAKRAGRSKHSNVSCLQYVPHVWRTSGSNQLYLCTIGKNAQEDMMRTGHVQSAASVAGRAIRWAIYYEAGLENAAVWDEFCKG